MPNDPNEPNESTTAGVLHLGPLGPADTKLPEGQPPMPHFQLSNAILEWLKDPKANPADVLSPLLKLDVPIHDRDGVLVARGALEPVVDPASGETSFNFKVTW